MNALSDTDRRESFRLEVREKDGGKGVFAREDILMNSVFELGGVVSGHPDRHSLQLGQGRHLHVPTDKLGIDSPDFFWRYLNHSCQPNGYINTAELSFVALRKISKGEECTFNYLTTEFEMAVPFTCRCGAVNCFGLIQGYAHLSVEQKEELAALAVTSPTLEAMS
jgi:SET domain